MKVKKGHALLLMDSIRDRKASENQMQDSNTGFTANYTENVHSPS